MYNLDMIGLILLFATLIIGGNLLTRKRNQARQKFPVQPVRENFTTETAQELFPDIQFPPEIEHEHIPELPWGYGDNKIAIMARDPEWIYAYWEISAEKLNTERKLHGSRWAGSLSVLRVYDVTGINDFDGYNANSYYDVIINDFAGSWYLNVGTPDRLYCVDLGRILSDGIFTVLARSNYTFTPRNSMSDIIDPEWMLVSDQEKKLYARIGYTFGPISSEFFKH